MDTRWLDQLGREWRIVEKRPFGQNNCVTTGRPHRFGFWTSREIRIAIGTEAMTRRATTGDRSDG